MKTLRITPKVLAKTMRPPESDEVDFGTESETTKHFLRPRRNNLSVKF
jgi:hypothetical protein